MTKSILVAGMFNRDTQVITSATQAIQSLLREGQCLVDDTFHNAGWYNREGVKVGHGDISTLQLELLYSYLPVGEVLFILNEQSSTWGVPKNLDQDNPGVDYVVEKASAVATPIGLITIPTNVDTGPEGSQSFQLFQLSASSTHGREQSNATLPLVPGRDVWLSFSSSSTFERK